MTRLFVGLVVVFVALPCLGAQKLTEEQLVKLEMSLAGKPPADQFRQIQPWLGRDDARLTPLVVKVFERSGELPLEYQQKLVDALLRHPDAGAFVPATKLMRNENVALARKSVRLVAATKHEKAVDALTTFYAQTKSPLLRMDVLTVLADLATPAARAFIDKTAGKDPLLAKALFVRVKLVRADSAPAQVAVGFRRGLYWKRTGTLGTVGAGEWTDWADCNEFWHGKGASDFVVIEFPGCKRFEAQYQLAAGGRILKTITETGLQKFSVIVTPRWRLRQGVEPTSDAFVAAFQSLTDFQRSRLKRFDERFRDEPKLPRLYGIEASYGGYVDANTTGRAISISGRTSSPEAVRAELGVLRHLGYNGFVGESNLALAEQFGLRNQFNRLITFSSAQAPWYQIPCPFDPKLKAKADAMVRSATARAEQLKDVKDIWIHWGDEIGVAAKGDHMKSCPVCAREFQAYLKGLGLTPATFGKKAWAEVIPFAGWEKGRPTAGSWPCKTPEEAADLYYSMRFMTVATAQVYRDAAAALKKLSIHASPLQGPTPSWNGHSQDWFEFYDTAPATAITWETSNRDPRVWQWCSYLASITRGIGRRHGSPVHVYIKPHRGAPTQRLFAVLSRGVETLCWYNYGPPYLLGDEFTGPAREPLMFEVAEAVRIVARAEDVTYGAERVPAVADVALVYPRTAFDLRRGYGSTNHLQDAKWVYLALRHDHIPVDVIDEAMLEDGGLEQRKALYVVGSHLREKSCEAVLAWVKRGGTLWTDVEGLSRNEFDRVSPAIRELTGQGARPITCWGSDPGYGATKLGAFRGSQGKPYAAPPEAQMAVDGKQTVTAAVGREVLDATGAEVLGRFSDGKPAVIRRRIGQGCVYIVATFAGLTYSEPVRQVAFDMERDLKAAPRKLITSPALAAKVRRPAVPADPLVEAVLVRKGDDAALYLMNWHWRSELDGLSLRRGNVPKTDLDIQVFALAGAAEVVSAGRHKVTAQPGPEGLTVRLDRLTAGDIILFRRAVWRP